MLHPCPVRRSKGESARVTKETDGPPRWIRVNNSGAETMDGRRRRPVRSRVMNGGAAAALALVAGLAAASSPFAASSTGTQPPTFVQQVSKRANASTLTLQPTSPVTAGNRLIVEVGMWNSTA